MGSSMRYKLKLRAEPSFPLSRSSSELQGFVSGCWVRRVGTLLGKRTDDADHLPSVVVLRGALTGVVCLWFSVTILGYLPRT